MQQPVLHEAHDAPAGGHFGADWRYLHMKDLYFQKNLQRNTQQYIADYNLCHQTNNRSGNPMGLLQTFPVAKCHWQRIGIDFITDLAIPETEHDCLILFVDHMATGAYWPACSKTIDTLTFALIFIDDIVRRYGVPQKAVLNHCVHFTADYWREVVRILQTKLLMSTAFNPETNGLSERLIGMVTQSVSDDSGLPRRCPGWNWHRGPGSVLAQLGNWTAQWRVVPNQNCT